MRAAKQIADLITLARGLIAVALAWLGLARPAGSLPLAVCLMIADWTGDYLDGQVARRGPAGVHTWIGDHDLQIDMLVSLGLLVYLLGAGLLSPWLAGFYLLPWLAVFWRVGVPRALGMLFQAPIYAWFIGTALVQSPGVGVWLLVWIAAAVVLTWPQFPKEIVPGFLAGMRRLWHNVPRPRR
jgi:hypothetical protein